MRSLKLGIFLPTFESPDGSLFPGLLRWPELLSLTRHIEAAGFDSVWIPDHLLIRWVGERGSVAGAWDGWSLMAALAAATEHIELGTLVLCTTFRNPALLAKMADTVDEISNGRLILGLGAGDHEPEFRAFGYPFDHRVSRFEEALTIITSLLRDGAIDFEGTYYAARACELRPRAARPGGPPIMVGGGFPPGPRMVRLGVEHADIWNHWLAFDRSYPDALPPLRHQVDAACATIGRAPTTLRRTVTVAVVPPGHQPAHTAPNVEAVTGSAEEIAAVLGDFAQLGVDHLQLLLNPCNEAAIDALLPVLDLLDRG
ncbi:MAG TPA: LLM class flavin-dependent oxidoreductase [Thermomicrobiales bacterium]|nr:LLM class flavin-dependent oxidoreductase [Thermomicrobiales bacterium]